MSKKKTARRREKKVAKAADTAKGRPRTTRHTDASICGTKETTVPQNDSSASLLEHGTGAIGDSKTACEIRFSATLFRPAATAKSVSWTFLTLPKEASSKLPSRGQTTVEGTFNGFPFSATLDPDGQGGHWLKVDRKLRESAGAEAGDVVTLEIAPVAKEPEPKVPADLRKALAAAPPKAREVWEDITTAARRDFIHWITSPKRPETHVKRIATACDMLAKGKRRPCCFDRSGMYDKSLSCPVADDGSDNARR